MSRQMDQLEELKDFFKNNNNKVSQLTPALDEFVKRMGCGFSEWGDGKDFIFLSLQGEKNFLFRQKEICVRESDFSDEQFLLPLYEVAVVGKKTFLMIGEVRKEEIEPHDCGYCGVKKYGFECPYCGGI